MIYVIGTENSRKIENEIVHLERVRKRSRGEKNGREY